MKKFVLILTLAFTLLVSLTSTAKSVVQQGLDKNIFIVSQDETVFSQTVTPLVLSESPLVRELQRSNVNYSFETFRYTRYKNDNYKYIVTPRELFVPNKDVIWLTNMKSK